MFLENLRRCYNINLNDYENIGINLEINKVLLPAFIIFGILMVLLSVYRKNTRDLVIQLMRHNALSEKEAKTLDELGFKENRVVRYILSHSDMLKKTVLRADVVKYTYEEYKALSNEERREVESIDFLNAKFYIPEDHIDRARHIKEKYVVDKTRLIIGCAFLFIVYVGIVIAMPEMLNVINGILKPRI
jgi:DNA-directed RNA polymerase subunit N (RpoN/RPB10)